MVDVTISVVTLPTGQLVTVGLQEVTVYTLVVVTTDVIVGHDVVVPFVQREEVGTGIEAEGEPDTTPD